MKLHKQKTMNRINNLFRHKPQDILNVYFTAGYPELESTTEILEHLEVAGVDMVEIGMPYSDPLADGPTIQKSSTIALENGMSVSKLFSQLEGIRSKIKIPVILMGYLNPVIQYGAEAFFAKCSEVGVDALILPDMPLYEYKTFYKDLFNTNGIKPIFLITPGTSVERIRKIDALTDAFIYVVSTASTTGKSQGFSPETISYFDKIKNMNLKNPTLIGFGISDNKSFKKACEYTSGAIIGSEFIRVLERSGGSKQGIQEFVEQIRGKVLTE